VQTAARTRLHVPVGGLIVVKLVNMDQTVPDVYKEDSKIPTVRTPGVVRESGMKALVVNNFPIAQPVTLEVNVSTTENARIQTEIGIYIMENVEEMKRTTQNIAQANRLLQRI